MTPYISQQKSQLLDSLETQVRFSQLVAVLVGDKGLGKTFLLEQLQSRLSEEVALASIDASIAMSEEQLDKSISLQLGLSWQDTDSQLAERIASDHQEKVLITIDNAHLLSLGCLEFVLKLNQSQLTAQESVFFILLAGENSLPAAINKTITFNLHPDMCVVFEIEPIQQSETKQVVETFSHPNSHVLSEMGESTKLDYFWQLSKGNPAELNYHVSRWLDEYSPTKVVEVNLISQPRTIIKASIYTLLVVLLLVMLIYQNEINQWISSGAQSQVTSTEPKEKADGSVEINLNLEAQNDQSKRRTKSINPAVEKAPLATAEEMAGDPLVDRTEVASSEGKKGNIQLVDKALENTDSTKKIIEKQQNPIDNPSINATDKIAVKPIPPAILASVLTADERKLLNQDSGYFVLQWAGVSSKLAAQKYVETHLAKNQMRIYRRENKTKTLYLVVSDYFSNRALAEFALNDYLQQGAQEKPWIKSIGLVQKEIKQFEQVELKRVRN